MTKTGIVTGALWRVHTWELLANDLFVFLSLDISPTGAENLRGGLHAAPVTGNDAVVAASVLALRQFSNSSGVTYIKEIWARPVESKFIKYYCLGSLGYVG
jgi:hypothetical protein